VSWFSTLRTLPHHFRKSMSIYAFSTFKLLTSRYFYTVLAVLSKGTDLVMWATRWSVTCSTECKCNIQTTHRETSRIGRALDTDYIPGCVFWVNQMDSCYTDRDAISINSGNWLKLSSFFWKENRVCLTDSLWEILGTIDILTPNSGSRGKPDLSEVGRKGCFGPGMIHQRWPQAQSSCQETDRHTR
jgi:hypothetical protein